MIKFHILSFC